MATCKKWLHFEVCKDKLGTTKYYDNAIATDNVEALCKNFIGLKKDEIDKLENVNKKMDDFARELCTIRMLKGKTLPDAEDLLDYIETEKCKAIKEFAEKVKEESAYCSADTDELIIFESEFDNLVERMTGENNV